MADELKKEGVIDENTTISNASDLLSAVSNASGVAASALNTPPISLDGLHETIQETRSAIVQIDPAKVLPQAELERMWDEMHSIASKEDVSVFEVSTAMALHSLDRVADVGRGALSTTRAATKLFDRHVIDHYRSAITDLETNGYYATLAEKSGPYVDAVWKNFSTDQGTITEDLLSGRLVGKAATMVGRWLGATSAEDQEKKMP